MSKDKKTKFEAYVVRKVKAKRDELKLSQSYIANVLNVSRGYIGQVESPSFPAKYTLQQLNMLANEMDCSPKDFLPDNPII